MLPEYGEGIEGLVLQHLTLTNLLYPALCRCPLILRLVRLVSVEQDRDISPRRGRSALENA